MVQASCTASVDLAIRACVEYKDGDVYVDGPAMAALGKIDYTEFLEDATSWVLGTERLFGRTDVTVHHPTETNLITIDIAQDLCGALFDAIMTVCPQMKDFDPETTLLTRANELYVQHGHLDRVIEI